MLNIYKIVETKSGAEVYANFWSETYYRYGSLLKNYSGGSYPGVMYLKKTKDGYRVIKTRYAKDGAFLEKSIWKDDERFRHTKSEKESLTKIC